MISWMTIFWPVPQWCDPGPRRLSRSQDLPQHTGQRGPVRTWSYNYSQESYHLMIYGEMNYSPVWGKVIVNINHLLLTLSSALNIIIYSYKVSRHFEKRNINWQFSSPWSQVTLQSLRVSKNCWSNYWIDWVQQMGLVYLKESFDSFLSMPGNIIIKIPFLGWLTSIYSSQDFKFRVALRRICGPGLREGGEEPQDHMLDSPQPIWTSSSVRD